ncbi:MAG: CHASE2 domain-containing protein, partial [Candidatus Omnitrophica bacterium]|nr:CHASE2 domain-containing protein [Candidatus Omnitrophota bacterium]
MAPTKRNLRIQLILVFSCLLIIAMPFFPFLEGPELSTYDLRFKLRPPAPVSGEIVIIEISDDTLNNLGKWPLPRDFHASLINVLKEFGVKSIVFDILFSEPTEHDDVFSEAIREAGNVYLPVAFYLPAVSPGRSDPAVESPGLLAGPRDLFVKSAKGTGHINVFVDSDGKVRSVPLFVRFDNKIFPQLALKVANDYLGAGHFDLKAVVPFQVNYPGLWETSFRHLSYFEVLKSYSGLKKGIKSELDLSLLKNKICFIGLTATGTSDLQPVPLENIYPLVGLQASVLNSILTGKFIRDTGILPNTLINLFLFFACLIICIRFAPLRAFFGALGLAAAYFILALVLFIFGLWVGLFNPLLILAATYIVITLYRFLAEIRRRELLEKELEIAREIQKSFLPEDVKMPQGLPVFVSFEPARFVAGDLYDIHKISADKG